MIQDPRKGCCHGCALPNTVGHWLQPFLPRHGREPAQWVWPDTCRPDRVFLHCSIFESFLAKLSEKLSPLKIGDPIDEATDIGAIISGKQFDRVCGYIDDGRRQPGARLVLGGLLPQDGPLAQGYFVQPTVFADVRNDWRIAREEIFGPVMVAIPWEDEGDAVRTANDSHYGLAAYVWTRDLGKAIRTADAIESGWVQINQPWLTEVAAGRAEPQRIVDGLKQRSVTQNAPVGALTLADLGAGNTSDAIDALERVYTERDGYAIYVNIDPLMDSLRKEPRFQALCRRLLLGTTPLARR